MSSATHSLEDSATGFTLQPLANSTFGALVQFDPAADESNAVEATVRALEAQPEALPAALNASQGLLVLPAMQAISQKPELLVRLSQLFGPEVEDYRQTLTPTNMIHESVSEILMVCNRAPVNMAVPDRPDPPLTANGELPVQFPHRHGWHTDQSFRRPPPDISLFYAEAPCPRGQGQTLFANGTAAYEALPDSLRTRIDGLDGLHGLLGAGRSEAAVREGQTPMPLLPHQYSQRQPLARVHPVTGRRALYLCEGGQMDWIDGPIADLEPGPDGEGAQLLRQLLAHVTQRQFVYAHDWNPGDLVVYDNRCLLHAGAWYDTAHLRLMWRTTVVGNPGREYAGEKKSWLPEGGGRPMDGLGNLQWRGGQADP